MQIADEITGISPVCPDCSTMWLGLTSAQSGKWPGAAPDIPAIWRLCKASPGIAETHRFTTDPFFIGAVSVENMVLSDSNQYPSDGADLGDAGQVGHESIHESWPFPGLVFDHMRT